MEEEQMRRMLGLVLSVVVIVSGCSSGESFAVEFAHPNTHEASVPFTATGVAVTEGVMCRSGGHRLLRLENMDGVEISDEEWAVTFDAAMAAEGVAEMMVFLDWTCDDGSGSFAFEFNNRFDFATFAFSGQHDVGTWEITGGTGSYADVTGSGSGTLDLDAGSITYMGEITEG